MRAPKASVLQYMISICRLCFWPCAKPICKSWQLEYPGKAIRWCKSATLLVGRVWSRSPTSVLWFYKTEAIYLCIANLHFLTTCLFCRLWILTYQLSFISGIYIHNYAQLESESGTEFYSMSWILKAISTMKIWQKVKVHVHAWLLPSRFVHFKCFLLHLYICMLMFSWW